MKRVCFKKTRKATTATLSPYETPTNEGYVFLLKLVKQYISDSKSTEISFNLNQEESLQLRDTLLQAYPVEYFPTNLPKE